MEKKKEEKRKEKKEMKKFKDKISIGNKTYFASHCVVVMRY